MKTLEPKIYDRGTSLKATDPHNDMHVRSNRRNRNRTNENSRLEDNIANGGWKDILPEDKEGIDAERLGCMENKLFEESLVEEDLKGLTQEELSAKYAKDRIPDCMEFIQFVEMIEEAGVIEEDFYF